MPVHPKTRGQVVESWEEALALVDPGPRLGRTSRVVAPNTTAAYQIDYQRSQDDPDCRDVVEIALYGHVLIRFYPDRIEFTDAGHRTVTTKDRLNRFLPFHVWQDRGSWYYGSGHDFLHGRDYSRRTLAAQPYAEWNVADYEGRPF